MAPTGKREIPTALEFMKARQEKQPGTTHEPKSPGVSSGPDMPTQSTGRVNGQKTKKSPNPGHGNREPASKFRGNGKKQNTLQPQKGKASPSIKHGSDSAKHVPSMKAVSNRLRGVGPHGNANISKSGGRSGILSKFEGFNNTNVAG